MSQQIIAAHPDDAARTLKILKRVCNQHNTGIRKHFSVMGRICCLEIQGGLTWLVFLDEPGGRAHRLTSVTPDSILEKIHIQVCTSIMDS